MLKKLKKNRKALAGATIVVLSILIAFIALTSSGNKYSGLGEESLYEACPYNMKNLYSGDKGLAYDDKSFHSRKGIDVSVFQGDIDWKKVKASGIDFVMIRLGFRSSESGIIHLDSKFEDNVKGAKEAGLNVGVYFFSQAINTEEAIEEAKFVLKHIRFRGIDYPVAFDMEPVNETDRIKNLSAMEKTEIADAFCKTIKKKGHKSVIYGNPTWLRNHINLDFLTEHELWLAHYTPETDFSSKFRMWQYTETGLIDGIDGYVDFNLYFEEKTR